MAKIPVVKQVTPEHEYTLERARELSALSLSRLVSGFKLLFVALVLLTVSACIGLAINLANDIRRIATSVDKRPSGEIPT